MLREISKNKRWVFFSLPVLLLIVLFSSLPSVSLPQSNYLITSSTIMVLVMSSYTILKQMTHMSQQVPVVMLLHCLCRHRMSYSLINQCDSKERSLQGEVSHRWGHLRHYPWFSARVCLNCMTNRPENGNEVWPWGPPPFIFIRIYDPRYGWGPASFWPRCGQYQDHLCVILSFSVWV